MIQIEVEPEFTFLSSRGGCRHSRPSSLSEGVNVTSQISHKTSSLDDITSASKGRLSDLLPIPKVRNQSCSVLPVSQQATAYSLGMGVFNLGSRTNAGEKTGVCLD